MANSDNNIASQNEIVLGENEMVCSLTNRVVKATDKEMTLQSMIAMMTDDDRRVWLRPRRHGA